MGDSEEDRKERVKKYRQLYSMAEAAFKDEENRYIRVEDVALKYVPILLFLFGVAGYFAKWILDEMIVCIDSLEVAAITCITSAFLLLVFAALMLLRSFFFTKTVSFRPGKEVVDVLEECDLATFYAAFAKGFIEQREENARITDKRAQRYGNVYRLVFISFILLIITGVIYVAFNWKSLSLC